MWIMEQHVHYFWNKVNDKNEEPANIADIHFHSLWQVPTPQRQKKTHTIFFTGQKFHLGLVIDEMLISH